MKKLDITEKYFWDVQLGEISSDWKIAIRWMERRNWKLLVEKINEIIAYINNQGV